MKQVESRWNVGFRFVITLWQISIPQSSPTVKWLAALPAAGGYRHFDGRWQHFFCRRASATVVMAGDPSSTQHGKQREKHTLFTYASLFNWWRWNGNGCGAFWQGGSALGGTNVTIPRRLAKVDPLYRLVQYRLVLCSRSLRLWKRPAHRYDRNNILPQNGFDTGDVCYRSIPHGRRTDRFPPYYTLFGCAAWSVVCQVRLLGISWGIVKGMEKPLFIPTGSPPENQLAVCSMAMRLHIWHSVPEAAGTLTAFTDGNTVSRLGKGSSDVAVDAGI